MHNVPKLLKTTAFCCILIIAASVAAVKSSAAPFTPFFAPLLTELTNRLATYTGTLTAQQKKEKNAINSAIKSINKKSTSLTTDLKTAMSLVNSLDKTFPADLTIQGLEDDLLNSFSGAVTDEAAALEVTRFNMVAGTQKSQAQGLLLSANGLIVSSQSKPTHFLRAKELNNALASIVKAQKMAKVSKKVITDGGTCQVNGFSFISTSGAFFLSSNQFLIELTQGNGPASKVEIEYDLSSGFVAGGTYTITQGGGQYTNFDTGEVFPIDSGSIHIIDLNKNTKTVSGVFSFSGTGAVSGFLSVSQGYFTTKNLIVQ